MKDQASILKMYAVTPCHAGCGASSGIVDLPIQRERHTQWPVIQASGMKGAMRAHFDRFKENIKDRSQIDQFDQITEYIFGSEKSEFAGSLSVSDAKILAFPMRSNCAPFVWITCPAVLKRLNRDLTLAKKDTIKDLKVLDSLPAEKAWCIFGNLSGKVLLEDMEVEIVDSAAVLKAIAPLTPYLTDAHNLLVVRDDIFSYGVTSCTQVMAQIKINQATGTTQDGSLRYQEELPPDSIMYCVILWGPSRDGHSKLGAEAISQYLRQDVMNTHLQVGGDETLGRGIFELSWM